jgi:galactose mutarotase-like enzyme
MPSVSTEPSGAESVGDVLVLADERDGSTVEIAPRRGAIVTSFTVRERELLYLERATLTDAAKNVRGGVPVLFPSPGKLENDAFTEAGRTYGMKQHGFARNLPWTVESTTADDDASATLSLASSEATLTLYPFEFRARFTYSLRGTRLRISASVANDGPVRMPYGLGFHPYFRVADKAAAKIDTHATRAFDNVTKKDVAFTGFDFTVPEVDLHLLDHGGSSSALHLGDGSRIDVRGSPEFTRWVVWSLAGKDFVCLEPWTSPGNALNTKEQLLSVDPGATHTSWIEIAFD